MVNMEEKTLFCVPHNTCPRQFNCDNLNFLVAAYAESDLDPRQIAVWPGAIEAVVDAIPGKLVGIDKPGPFKKAAALTLALVENEPFYYLLSDIEAQPAMPSWNAELRVIAAIGIARLYLTATLPDWFGVPKTDFNAPSLVSGHFTKDFRALISNRHETMDIRILGLIWELMTYLPNDHLNIRSPRETDVGIPGVAAG